jgi:hypothetical protein
VTLAAAARAAALALGLAAGCSHPPAPITLGPTWPDQPGRYREVTEAWTRHAILRGQYQQVLELFGTLRSPAWYAAHAAREADIRNLQGAARDAVLAQARTAADGDYQIVLVVTTYDPSENDLHRGDRSVWRLALVGDDGRETPPSQIVRDKRPLEVLKAELPQVNEFSEVYVATFPRAANVLHDGAHRIALKMWSPRGGVELTWLAP